VVIKFCFNAGKTVTQTVEMVHTAYGDEAVMRYRVFGWYRWIREGREGNPRSGRASDGWQNWKMFGCCCRKIVPCHFE
jgi:hypothetical protein